MYGKNYKIIVIQCNKYKGYNICPKLSPNIQNSLGYFKYPAWYKKGAGKLGMRG